MDFYKLQATKYSFKIMSNTLSCQEVQLRFALQFHLTPAGIWVSKKTNDNKYW